MTVGLQDGDWLPGLTKGPGARGGRPRSESKGRAILEAARDLLVEVGYPELYLEHVAARAGVGKATIYRRWGSKEELVADLLDELAAPHLSIPDSGDTRAEMLAAVTNPIHALTATEFGPVLKALLAQIAANPRIGDPFRATVVKARRDQIAKVIRRGIARGDIRPDADVELATEMLVGPVYFRLVFGGDLDRDLADRVVDAVLSGYAT